VFIVFCVLIGWSVGTEDIFFRNEYTDISHTRPNSRLASQQHEVYIESVIIQEYRCMIEDRKETKYSSTQLTN